VLFRAEVPFSATFLPELRWLARPQHIHILPGGAGGAGGTGQRRDHHDWALERGGQWVTVVRKVRQTGVGKVRAGPSGFLESRTRTRCGVDATSTQALPLPLWLLVRQATGSGSGEVIMVLSIRGELGCQGGNQLPRFFLAQRGLRQRL
jgi:hypothetical protein